MFGKNQDEAKMKQRWIDFKHPWIGRNHTIKTKEKIRLAYKGKKLSEETKAKIQITSSGKNNGMYGKIQSEETREKIREKAIGRIWSEERKKGFSPSNKGKRYSNEEYLKLYEKIECLHCGKKVDKANLKRWHGDNCKNKIK